MKKFLIFGVSAILLLAFKVVSVKGQEKPKGKAPVSLPSASVEVSPNVYYLGSSKDKDGRSVQGYAYIHRDKNARAVKPPKGTDNVCYGFMAKGANWKSPENWIVNTDSQSGLDGQTVFENLQLDISKWEGASGKDILGNGSKVNETLVADMVSPDEKNEVYFADVDSPGAIAVTIVWGYFGGPIQTRSLIEWDQVYDDVDYPWSFGAQAGRMDFENIATHELGHSVGLDDLYTTSCTEETMYGYADYAETKKRDLNTGDIAGVKELYK